MKREEVLSLAKESSDRGMEYERKSILTADAISGYVGELLCIVFGLVNLLIRRIWTKELLIVLFTMLSISFINEGKKTNRKLLVLGGVFFIAIAVVFLLAYIGEIML